MFIVIFFVGLAVSIAFIWREFANYEIMKYGSKYPHENCDEACFYHCTKNGTQEPDCLTEKQSDK